MRCSATRSGRRADGPPFDPVLMFKIFVIQATNNLSDERAEFLINDRLSFIRFLVLGLEDRVPNARTIWLFREKLTTAGAIKRLFEQFDAMLRQAGYIAMSGQIASMPAWLRRRDSAVRTTRRRQSSRAGYRRIGRPSRPSCGTRIATRAGRSNSPRPNRARMAQRRQSIWQPRCLAIRTLSRSIAVSASSADGRPKMRLPMRAVVCAKARSTRAIRRAGCGPILPTDQRPTRRS